MRSETEIERKTIVLYLPLHPGKEEKFTFCMSKNYKAVVSSGFSVFVYCLRFGKLCFTVLVPAGFL